jgi:hypothetical protein
MGGRCDALASGVGIWGLALCAALLALLVALIALGFARWPAWPAPGSAARGNPRYAGGAESLHTLWCLSRRPGARYHRAGRAAAIHPTAGSSRGLAAGSGREGAATGDRSRREAWDNGKGRVVP